MVPFSFDTPGGSSGRPTFGGFDVDTERRSTREHLTPFGVGGFQGFGFSHSCCPTVSEPVSSS